MSNKDTNFSEWYNKIVRETDIIDDRYPIKGMPVYKPYGFRIVKNILTKLEQFLEKEGVEPCWFPVLIPESIFRRESQHIKGFEGEVFWITKGGFEELEEKYCLRPTSETEMYYIFKFWIQSYTDLPLKLYMTNTVYRYETKATKPLIRGREIIWNEAHTAHRTKEDAERMIKKSIEIYSKLFWDICSVPHIWMKRPEWDKFAGADYTIAADTILPDGRFLQIGTTHLLGQNFAKAFDIKFMDNNPYNKIDHNKFVAENKEKNIKIEFEVYKDKIKYIIHKNSEKIEKEYKLEKEINNISEENEELINIFNKILKDNNLDPEEFNKYKYIWQTSFGISMRFAAAVISIHGDDKGLILPFDIAPIQIVIVPIYYSDEEKESVLNFANIIYEKLKEKYRVYLDNRDDKTPGWKFNYWEFKGVPIRIEIGPKDIKQNQVIVAIRKKNEKSEKVIVKIDELENKLKDMIQKFDKTLKENAEKYFENKIVRIKSVEEIKKILEGGKCAKVPFCMSEECAKILKEKFSVEVRGVDYPNPEIANDEKCIVCGKKATYWVYLGKSY